MSELFRVSLQSFGTLRKRKYNHRVFCRFNPVTGKATSNIDDPEAQPCMRCARLPGKLLNVISAHSAVLRSKDMVLWISCGTGRTG
ncbi:uncharacterized protein BDZ83DRAFT_443307 [Colletotrichum acutatum]|uniref:Uncharacterized protein n=1 Tax=Glomerella acutata TaxID=27357 RepID=A0AAD8UHU6_GLOAC|nr:uncharacterized protein BDZ83DRAFT_443307 [Colletotrichum acutatum]KAK1720352.1 hypothetical protein BDZ83DRAFT_443307 [Colletotrichum acutatum]